MWRIETGLDNADLQFYLMAHRNLLFMIESTALNYVFVGIKTFTY